MDRANRVYSLFIPFYLTFKEDILKDKLAFNHVLIEIVGYRRK